MLQCSCYGINPSSYNKYCIDSVIFTFWNLLLFHLFCYFMVCVMMTMTTMTMTFLLLLSSLSSSFSLLFVVRYSNKTKKCTQTYKSILYQKHIIFWFRYQCTVMDYSKMFVVFVSLLLSSSFLRALRYMCPTPSSNSSSVMDCCGGSRLSKTLLLIQSHEVWSAGPDGQKGTLNYQVTKNVALGNHCKGAWTRGLKEY